MNNELSDMVRALRAIAEPTRLRILSLCRTGDMTVKELCGILGQSQPRISRHLKLLVDAGILEKLPEGASVFHRLTHNSTSATLAHQIAATFPDNDSTLKHDQVRLALIRKEREDKAAVYFRNNAKQWNLIRAMHVDEREVESTVISMLKGKDVGDLLDIGTGTGRMLEILAPFAERAEGIDRSRSMLAIARTQLVKSGIDNCHVRHGDMFELPFVGQSFDTVLIHQVLHYVDDPELAIDEAVKALRPGGRVLIVDFAPHNEERLRRDHAHHRLGFSTNEVKGWFENTGLKSIRTQHLKGTPLTVSLWLAEKPLTPATKQRSHSPEQQSLSH